MNLIKKQKIKSKIANFRQYQYNLIPEVLELGIRYLEQFGLIVDNNNFKIEILPNTNYEGLNYFAIRLVKMRISSDPDTILADFVIPELIQEQFFILNSSYYIPGIFIIDEPITTKKKSITLYALFNPLTLYFENNRAIFLGVNIPINRLFQLIFDKDAIKIASMFGLNISLEPIESVIQYFAAKFNLKEDIDVIISTFNKLIFDDWTKGLYKKFYNLIEDPDLKNIIIKASDNWNNHISFIDLSHKRLSFIEIFLTPFTQSIRLATWNLLNNRDVKQLKIKDNEITKFFFTGGSIDSGGMGNFYDTVNGYTSVLLMKGSMKPPGIKGRLPSIVSSIHDSHRGKICPKYKLMGHHMATYVKQSL